MEWTESELAAFISSNLPQEHADSHASPVDHCETLEGDLLDSFENVTEQAALENILPPKRSVASLLASAFHLPVDTFGCHAHAIELAIKDALGPIRSLLKDLRHFSKSFRKSSATRKYIHKFSDRELSFPGDSVTRWSSTFTLIDHFCSAIEPLKAACDDYDSSDGKISGMKRLAKLLQHDALHKLQRVLDVLRPTADMLRQLEGDSYPTLSLVQCSALALLNSIEIELQNETASGHASNCVREVYRTLKKSIFNRFIYTPSQMEDYMPIDYVAAALDPRTKLLAIVDTPAMRNRVWDWIESQLKAMHPSDDHADSIGSFSSINEAMNPYFSTGARSIRPNSLSVEIDRYKSESAILYNSNPLEWWKVNEYAYPNLARLARVYLAIPASSASSERIFSRAGYVMGNRRTRLAWRTFEAIVCHASNRKYVNDLLRRRPPPPVFSFLSDPRSSPPPVPSLLSRPRPSPAPNLSYSAGHSLDYPPATSIRYPVVNDLLRRRPPSPVSSLHSDPRSSPLPVPSFPTRPRSSPNLPSPARHPPAHTIGAVLPLNPLSPQLEHGRQWTPVLAAPAFTFEFPSGNHSRSPVE